MNRGRRQVTRGHTSCLTAGISCSQRGAHKERTPISTLAAWIHQSESSLLTLTRMESTQARAFCFSGVGKTLMGQQFDANKLELQGEQFRIVDQIDYVAATGRGFFSASQTGALTFVGINAPNTQLVWFDRGGKQLGQIGGPASDLGIRLSPDEKQLAVTRLDSLGSTSDIWLIDLARNNPSRLTLDPADESGPVWSPDGSRIIFSSDRGSGSTIYQRLSNGTGKDEVVVSFSAPAGPHDWSPDGKFIVFSIVSGIGSTDLWLVPLFGDRKPAPFVQTEFSERQARFSPDGKWIKCIGDVPGLC